MTTTKSPETAPMPPALIHYWTMWNEFDVELIRGHLDRAVTTELEWVDPLHSHVGRDALEVNVRTLRSDKPEYRFVITSEMDVHHNRIRYQWNMMRKHRVLMRGLDVVTLDPAGLIERVDGFFGEPRPVAADGSGVPEQFRS
jgi:hypothetical protein